jgi:hypothetical protein
VELPRRRIHAGLWFRLLRTLLDELNTPLSHCGVCAGSVRYVWERCGHPLRAGQSLWRPYEILDPAVQLQMLEAAATAIELIESKVVSPHGELAALFSLETQTGFTNGLSEKKRNPEPVDHWREAVKALDEAIAEAGTIARRPGHCSPWHLMDGATPSPWIAFASRLPRRAFPGISVTLCSKRTLCIP